MTEQFYDDLAPYYRYVYQDWDASVVRQGAQLDKVIRRYFPQADRILDAACGIGTQCIGLAQFGYRVTASDLSSHEVELARLEAGKRNLSIEFAVADMRRLDRSFESVFDVVVACDNAVPHLTSDADILQAFREFHRCTTPQGGCIISVRDYADLDLKDGSVRFYPRTVHRNDSSRLILFDLWELDDPFYDMTTYAVEDDGHEQVSVKVIRGGRYYGVTIPVLEKLFLQAGFARVITLREDYFQPLLVAIKKGNEI